MFSSWGILPAGRSRGVIYGPTCWEGNARAPAENYRSWDSAVRNKQWRGIGWVERDGKRDRHNNSNKSNASPGQTPHIFCALLDCLFGMWYFLRHQTGGTSTCRKTVSRSLFLILLPCIQISCLHIIITCWWNVCFQNKESTGQWWRKQSDIIYLKYTI